MSVDWHGEEWLEYWHERTANGVEKAGDTLSQRMTEKVSTPGPPRSRPEEAPHIDSGELHETMTFEADRENPDPTCKAGTPLDYGLYLEFGTGSRARDVKQTKRHGKSNQIAGMAPRPWCLNTLTENEDEVVNDVLSE